MKAKFTGDPYSASEQKNLPETFTAFGVTFERGKYADVPDEVANKIANNSHFKVQGDVPEADEKSEAELLAELEQANARRVEEAEAAANAHIEQMRQSFQEELAAERARADEAEAALRATEETKTVEKRGPGRPPKGE